MVNSKTFAFGAVAAVCASTIAVNADFNDRIVGGEDTDPAAFPWMVSLARRGRHFCGGSLIAPNLVMTAAHCTVYSARDIQIRVKGSGSVSWDGAEVLGVKSITDHPDYSSSSQSNDIAILELSGESTITPVQYDESPASDVAYDGIDLTTIGWGTTREGGSVSPDLLQVIVPGVSNAECEKGYGSGRIPDDMICAGYPEGGKDACQGDSGGPLFVPSEDGLSDVVVGVVSWGRGCARRNYYGVYARVAYLVDFVKQFTSEDIVPPPGNEEVAQACQCVAGAGRFEICDTWYTEYKSESDPLYLQTTCLLDYPDGPKSKPTCVAPQGSEILFSESLQRWYMNGCTPGVNVFLDKVVYNETPIDGLLGEKEGVNPAVASPGILVATALITAGVVGLAAFGAHKRAIQQLTFKDDLNDYRVGASKMETGPAGEEAA